MDALRQFLKEVHEHGHARGQFLGLLNILIGRRITRVDGTVISQGLTWRELASWLKKIRWEKEAVTELGLEPNQLPPRDRLRYWYTAITRARVDAPEATEAGDRLAEVLAQHGYVVGTAPGS